MKLTSSAFNNNSIIPSKYGYHHGNFSPPLKIENIPDNTKSLVLIMDDPDALPAVGKIWVHWTLWNISPQTSEILENTIPVDCIQGLTDFEEIGYGGPAPPDKEHTYFFRLFAIDKKIELKEGVSRDDLEKEIENSIIEECFLKGKYSPQ